jgi:kynurenine formamidase
MGGDLEDALNQRCLIGAFPLPIEGGEASPCRVVAFLDD